MDLADRIKIFINFLAIGSSQFADNCKIPRPTLSQILNGRNKKVSDEIIGKIHQTYPSLSVLWLMFGEGEMTMDENTQISEPQEGEIIDFGNVQNTDNGLINPIGTNTKPVQDFGADKFDEGLFSNIVAKSTEKIQNTKDIKTNKAAESELTNQKVPITITPDNGNRKIVNIMVFYSDNSFETFTPAGASVSID